MSLLAFRYKTGYDQSVEAVIFLFARQRTRANHNPTRLGKLEAVMTRGVSEKGYKLTQNRKNILNLLIEEGGAIKSKEGRATALMHGLLEHGGSLVSLNATLRELESLGFIERQVEGRRTYGISIAKKALEELKDDLVEVKPVSPPAGVETNGAAAQPSETVAVVVQSSAGDPGPPAPVSDFDWDDNDGSGLVLDGIDYDVLLGVFLKAALRGMEGPSNGELEYYQQQNTAAMARIEVLEAEVDKLRGEAASAISERDQLQKNLNVLMSRSEQKRGRGSNPIRNLLKPDELAALDTLMRQIPTRQGE